MAEVATLEARILANFNQLHREARRAADNIRAMGDEMQRLEDRNRRTIGAMGRFADAAKVMQKAAQGVSLATAAAVTSLAAVGIEYNTLMQRTNAAFKTMLGGAGAASNMIEELMEFARGSPFPRQVFIEATQQLLGFGMAAEKVIPSFRAIQDAVAATGGGANELRMFTDIFAQIQSFGRANTETLQRFAFQGIDAFQMLADQSGESIETIRQKVTEGMLDANTTIEMLTRGLSERFGGAAANVKETWIGAVDRIKGAWRDIGSELMSPFIDPNGGGAAVVWANQLADLLRHEVLEKAVKPLAAELTVMFERFAQATQGFDIAGTFGKVAEFIQPMMADLERLAPVLLAVGVGFAKAALSAMPLIGPLVEFLPIPGALAGGLLALALSTKESRDAMLRLGESIMIAVGAVLPDLIELFGNLVKIGQELTPAVADAAAEFISGLTPALFAVVAAADAFLDLLRPLVTFTVDLLDSVGLLTPAIYALAAAFAALKVSSAAGAVGLAQHAAMISSFARPLITVTAAIAVGTTLVKEYNAAHKDAARVVKEASDRIGTDMITSLDDYGKKMRLVRGDMETLNRHAENAWNPGMSERAHKALMLYADIADQMVVVKDTALALSSAFGLTEQSAFKLSSLFEGNSSAATAFAQGMRELGVEWTVSTQAATNFGMHLMAMGKSIDDGRVLMDDLTEKFGASARVILPLINNAEALEAAFSGDFAALADLVPEIEELTDAMDEAAAAAEVLLNPMFALMDAQAAVASGAGDMSDAVRRAQDSLAGAQSTLREAQENLREVEARTWGVAEANDAARDAVSGLISAQKAQMDPVFAMIDALERQSDLFDSISGVGGEWDGWEFEGGDGAATTAADFAQAALDVEAAAMRLVGAIRAGDTSFESIDKTLRRLVTTGALTQKQYDALTKEITGSLNAAEGLVGDVVDSAITAEVDIQMADFEDEKAADMADAVGRVADAGQRVADAQQRAADTGRAMEESWRRNAENAMKLDAAMGNFNTALSENPALIGDSLAHIDRWLEEGLIPSREEADELRNALAESVALAGSFGSNPFEFSADGSNVANALIGAANDPNVRNALRSMWHNTLVEGMAGKVTDFVKSILDVLGLGGVRVTEVQGGHGGSAVTRLRTGGPVPGLRDSAVPIVAHGGEFVLSADVVEAIKRGGKTLGLGQSPEFRSFPTAGPVASSSPTSVVNNWNLNVPESIAAGMTEIDLRRELKSLSHLGSSQ